MTFKIRGRAWKKREPIVADRCPRPPAGLPAVLLCPGCKTMQPFGYLAGEGFNLEPGFFILARTACCGAKVKVRYNETEVSIVLLNWNHL